MRPSVQAGATEYPFSSVWSVKISAYLAPFLHDLDCGDLEYLYGLGISDFRLFYHVAANGNAAFSSRNLSRGRSVTVIDFYRFHNLCLLPIVIPLWLRHCCSTTIISFSSFSIGAGTYNVR